MVGDKPKTKAHYECHDQLRSNLQLFLNSDNHARRINTLTGLTAYEHVLQAWTKELKRFRTNPSHHIPAPYTYLLDAAGLRFVSQLSGLLNARAEDISQTG